MTLESRHPRSAPRIAFVVLAICALLPAASGQGETGFLRGAGSTDVVLYYNLDTYDDFWMGSTKVRNSMPGFGDVDRATYGLYAAWGATDDIDLTVQGNYITARSDHMFSRESELQDGAFRIKWKVAERRAGPGNLSFLLAPGVKVPLSDYETNSVTAIGDGQTDYLGRLIAHYHLDNGAFLSLETGYDRRSGRTKDEVPIHFTAGTTWNRLTVAPFYSRVESLGGIDLGMGAFPAAEEDYERVGVSLYYRVTDQVGITGNVRTTLDGRNTGNVDGFAAGLVFRF